MTETFPYENVSFGLPIVFEKFDPVHDEITELGRVLQTDAKGDSTRSVPQSSEFRRYLKSIWDEAKTFVREQEDKRNIASDDSEFLKLYYVLKQGRSFNAESSEVRSRVYHGALERPLPFREFPLAALLYGFTKANARFDTVYELDSKRPLLMKKRGNEPTLVCRYRHGNTAERGLRGIEKNHANLAGSALHYLARTYQLLQQPETALVQFVGYRASRPITSSVHEIPKSAQSWGANLQPDDVWADAAECSRPSSIVVGRHSSQTNF